MSILLIGEINLDIFVLKEKSLHTDKFFIRPGGVTLNIGYSLKGLNIKPKLFSFLGKDLIGETIKREISKDFDLDLINETNSTNIMIYEFSKRGLKILGLKKENPTFILNDKLLSIMENIKIIHFSPYIFFNKKNIDFTFEILKFKKINSINLSLSFLENCINIDILKNFDYIFMNYQEAKRLSKLSKLNEILNFLKNNFNNSILTKRDSIYFVSKDKIMLKKVEFLKSKIDISAGDYFIGGFLYGLYNSFDIDRSIKIGYETSLKNIKKINLNILPL